MEKSIAIIHTNLALPAMLTALCSEIMPAVKVHHIIDDSLLDEVMSHEGPTTGVVRRICAYYQLAESIGVDAILNGCSSVGEVAEIAAQTVDVPVVKIDAAMAREAVRLGTRIAVVGTTATTMGPSSRLVEKMATEARKDVEVDQRLVDGALKVLLRNGNRELHNEMVLSGVEAAAAVNDVVVLAQGSMSLLVPLLADVKIPVLTSPRLALKDVRKLLYGY